jgi:hypothetical protein
MDKKIQVVVIAMILFSWLASPHDMPKREWTPGVSSGDYFTYEMYGVYTSNRSNSSINVPSFERNSTDWVRITITSVSGSVISQVYTVHYADGSETSFSFQTDVNPNNQGTFKISEKGVPICASNLKAGDRIPTAEVTLNQTIIRDSRETNHASWNVSDDRGDIYFDRQTGMLLEIHRTHIFANNATGEVVEKTDVVRLIQTNSW